MATDNGQSDVEIEVAEKQADPKALDRSVIDTPPPSQTPSIQSNLLMFLGGVAGEFEPWGQNVKLRDRQLRQFITTESMFTSALGIVCARNAGFEWVLEGPEQTVAVVQERLEASNQGKGWEDLIVTTSNDLYTQDTAAFIEIVCEGDSPESAFIGLNHLDSSRCWHTGNPEKPVLYQDRVGKWHLLDWWNVIELTEMPAGIEWLPGIQYSALTRLLLAAEIVKNISIYKNEKSGGRHNRALHLVSGVTTVQINAAVERYALYADSKGLQRYVNPIIIPAVDSDAAISHELIELAALPDNFDEDKMYKWYIAQIAMAFLTDYQEFAPLPGGNLGTSTQSEVLHLKSRGKGSGLFMNLITRALNFRVLPRGVTFRYLEQDLEAEEVDADIKKTRAETREIQVRTGEITSEQAMQMAADAGDILQEFLTTDITPNVTTPGEEPVESKEVTIPELVQRAKQEGGDGEHAGPFDDEYFASVERYATALLKGLKKIQKNVNRGLRTNLSKEVTFAVPDSVEFWAVQEQVMLDALGNLPADEMRVGVSQAGRLGLTFDFAMVNEDVLRLAETYTDAWWESFSTSTRNTLRSAIQANIESGEPLQALTKKITPLFGPQRAELIASTEITRLYAEGNVAAYRAAGIAEDEWRTVMDADVDEDCIALEGQRRIRDDRNEVPPRHPRCRCFLAPVVEDRALTEVVS